LTPQALLLRGRGGRFAEAGVVIPLLDALLELEQLPVERMLWGYTGSELGDDKPGFF